MKVDQYWIGWMILWTVLMVIIGLGIMIGVEICKDPLVPIESRINASSQNGVELQKRTQMIYDDMKKKGEIK